MNDAGICEPEEVTKSLDGQMITGVGLSTMAWDR